MALEEITPELARLKTLIANIYLVGKPGGAWVLVDSGAPGNAPRIREEAELRFGPNARPSAILLTHGHMDHAGSALELAEAWDVPIYAHRLERPFLTGKSAYPPKDPMAGGAFSFLCRFFPTTPPDLSSRLRDLPEGEVPGLPGWRWHFTPGHAPGHVVFFWPDEAILLAGDACVTMDLDSWAGMLTEAPVISRPPAPVTYDWKLAHLSVRLLADLRPAVLAAGHGKPMSGSAVTAGLADLAGNFPKPRHGRYSSEPARADETGVTFVPPPVADPWPKVAAAVGLATLALSAVAVMSRRGR